MYIYIYIHTHTQIYIPVKTILAALIASLAKDSWSSLELDVLFTLSLKVSCAWDRPPNRKCSRSLHAACVYIYIYYNI